MSRPKLLDALVSIGSAHAGQALTEDELAFPLLCSPAFRAKFNGPPPAEVVFPDEETAAFAAKFENQGRRG